MEDKSRLIHDLRFGYVNVKSLPDSELVVLLDYNISPQVIGLISLDIARRRKVNLASRLNPLMICRTCGSEVAENEIVNPRDRR